MEWREFRIKASAEAAEAVAALFGRWGEGVVIEQPVKPAGDADEYVLTPDALRTIRTYVPEAADWQRAEQAIEQAVGILRAFDLAPLGDLQVQWVAEADWAEAWKVHYQTFRLGRRWLIRPPWLDDQPGPDDLVLILDPGMAFGTGLHPSTQLCLELLETVPVAGAKVLDLGTGSGILAIASARLNAAQVLAADVDMTAVQTATANVRRNGVRRIVEVQHATLGPPPPHAADSSPPDLVAPQGQFDLVLANIVARVIGERADSLAAALRPGGMLIAGGIMADREALASEALADAGLQTLTRRTRGDWISLLLQR